MLGRHAIARLANPYSPAVLPGASALAHAWYPDGEHGLVFADPMRPTKFGGTFPSTFSATFSGGEAPDVSLSGPIVGLLPIAIEITQAGDETTARYRWARNGESGTWDESNVLMTPTHALTGTGRTAHFGVGNYRQGVLYQQCATSIGNLVPGKAALGAAGGSKTPVWVANTPQIAGRSSLRFPGDCALALDVTAPGSGNNQPFSASWIAQHAGGTEINAAWTFQSGGAGGSGVVEFYSEGGTWKISKRNDAGINTVRSGGVADNNWHHFFVAHDGTTVALWVDDIAITLSSAALNVGLTTLGRIALGGSTQSVLFYPVNMGPFMCWNTAVSTFARKANTRALRRLYGFI